MIVILKKLLHEFWLAKAKLVLCILASSISIWGISTAVITYLLSERDFKLNYERSIPSDFTFIIENYNDTIAYLLDQNESIQSIERREIIIGKIKNKAGKWLPLALFGLESLETQMLDRIEMKELDADDGLFIEQGAISLLDLDSDQVTLRLNTDKEIVTKVNGKVHDALQAPAQMEQVVYGYLKLSSIDSLLTSDKARLIIRASDDDKNITSLGILADSITQLIEANGGSVLFKEIKEPGKHVHQPIIDGVNFLQISFGLILVIIGVTLLLLILLTWLLQQVPQIGIIKSMGASQKQIFLAYTFTLLLILGCGLAIGMPIGLFTSKLFNKFIAQVQNFEMILDPFPIWYYVIIALMAIAPSLVICLLPIKRFTNLPVRVALSKTFYTNQTKVISFLSNLELSSKLKYSVTNVFRNGYRAYLLIALFGLGLCLYLAGVNLSHSFNQDLDAFMQSTPYQLTANLQDSTKIDLAVLRDQKGVKSYAPMQFIEADYELNGVNSNTYLRIYSKDYVISSDMFSTGSKSEKCSQCVYVTPNMLEDSFSNIPIGTEIKLKINNETVAVRYAGVMNEISPTRASVLYWYTDQNLDVFNKIAIAVEADDTMTDAVNIIDQLLKSKGIEVNSISTSENIRTVLTNHFQPTYLIVQGVGIFTVVLAILGMLIVINLTLRERIAEIGVLKALGASSKAISGLLSMEFFTLTIISIIISLPLSIMLSERLCSVYGNMIRGREFELSVNVSSTVIFILLLLISQWVLITIYARKKVAKSSNDLINFYG